MCFEPPKLWASNQCQDKQATDTLTDVLSRLNLAKYNSCFELEDIDLETFLTLSDEDFKQIGIKYVTFHS